MSAVLSVCGVAPADEKYLTMRMIYQLCKNSKVSIPPEVEDFFKHHEYQDGAGGIEVSIESTRFSEGMSEGMLVELAKLPKDVKYVKFTVSY